MKLPIAALTALSCVYWTVSGKLVEMVVRLGDDVTLHCDCEFIMAQDIQWVKVWSPQTSQPLSISAYTSHLQPVPRFSVSWNRTVPSYDLVIQNITAADLGLYYCSRVEFKIVEENGKISESQWIHTGETVINLTDRPSLESLCKRRSSSENSRKENDSAVEVDTGSSARVCGCWTVLHTVCPALSLLSAVLAFVCVCSCCHRSGKQSDARCGSETLMSRDEDVCTEVCYTSLSSG